MSSVKKESMVEMNGNVKSIEAVSGGTRSIRGMRYLILISTMLCLSSIMANIVTFNFTVLCMTRSSGDDLPHANETILNTVHNGYTKREKTIIFSSVAVGALLAVIPITYGIQYYGARLIFFACGILTGTVTLLVPLAAVQNSLIYFVILRIGQGISFAACMPTTGVVTSNWASLKQNGLFISSLTTFAQIAGVFTMSTSGQICTSKLGWPAVYYLHAAISFITFGVWVMLFRNQPANHPLVNEIELEQITRGKSSSNLRALASKRSKIPYLAILATPAIWGVWATAIADLLTLQLIHTFSPQYIKEILGYSVESTGFSAACPVLFQFLVKVTAGHSSDKLRCLSETTKIRLYNSIALGVSAIFLIALAFLPPGYPLVGVILLTLATAMYGFNGAGFNKCATLVSRQHSQFVLGHIQIIWCGAMLVCPIFVNSLLGEGTIYDWRLIYLLHAGISLIGNALFCVVATAKAAWWTEENQLDARIKNGGTFWWWWWRSSSSWSEMKFEEQQKK